MWAEELLREAGFRTFEFPFLRTHQTLPPTQKATRTLRRTAEYALKAAFLLLCTFEGLTRGSL